VLFDHAAATPHPLLLHVKLLDAVAVQLVFVIWLQTRLLGLDRCRSIAQVGVCCLLEMLELGVTVFACRG